MPEGEPRNDATLPKADALCAMEFVPNIWVREGNFSLHVVTSVADAVAFLSAWPADRRSPFFYLAHMAMESVIAGTIPLEEARETFCLFCREAGILAESAPDD